MTSGDFINFMFSPQLVLVFFLVLSASASSVSDDELMFKFDEDLVKQPTILDLILSDSEQESSIPTMITYPKNAFRRKQLRKNKENKEKLQSETLVEDEKKDEIENLQTKKREEQSGTSENCSDLDKEFYDRLATEYQRMCRDRKLKQEYKNAKLHYQGNLEYQASGRDCEDSNDSISDLELKHKIDKWFKTMTNNVHRNDRALKVNEKVGECDYNLNICKQ
jgi:hypothetical protein